MIALAQALQAAGHDAPLAAPPENEHWVRESGCQFHPLGRDFKAFMDTLGGVWFNGQLANKVYAGFTSAQNPHGGQEATLLSLYTTFYHWGGYIVTPGYTDPVVFAAGGNPYGPSVTTGPKGDPPTEADLQHALYLGRRITEVAAKVR